MRTPGIAAPVSRMRVLAYTRTDVFEEDGATVNRAAELVEMPRPGPEGTQDRDAVLS